MSEADNNSVRLTNFNFYENEFINNIAKWAVTEIFQEVWMDEKWDKCAKGGDAKESYRKKRDMSYLAHIFSGMSMALKVLDYKYCKYPLRESEESDIEKKIKRSILGYLFHDYNKLDGSDINMKDKEFILLNSELYFKHLMEELDLSVDDIYQIAFSTEIGTEFNVNRNDVKIVDLHWESSFSRLADSLSSIYNEESMIDWDFKRSIDFNNESVIPKDKIERFVFSSTNFIALTQIVRTSIINLLKDDAFYMWSSINAIYFVRENNFKLSFNIIIEEVQETLSRTIKPENGIKFTDRRVDNSSSILGTITHGTIREYVKDSQKFKNCLHLDDIKFDQSNETNRIFAERFSDLVSDKTKSFSFNYRSISDKIITGLRQGLNVSDDYDAEKYENERVRSFLVRYVQLSPKLDEEPVMELREKLSETLKNYYDTYLKGLLGKKEHEKSTLLIPFLIGNETLKWKEIEDSVIKDMNKVQPDVNLEGMISMILSGNSSKISDFPTNIKNPEVPDKKDMSMINGFPAVKKATGENLFGLGTNTFNNRLPTSGITNGKIDIYSYYEFALRKNFMANGESGGEALVFLHFPGSVPFLDLGILYGQLGKKGGKTNNFRELGIAIDAYDRNPFKRDNEFFFAIDSVRKDETLLKYVFNMLEIARTTKMMVKLAFSNAPIFTDQFETISIEIEGSVTTGMKYNKIRCNRIKEVISEIEAFNCLADNELLGKGDLKNTSQIMRDYLQNELSIFFHVHKLISSKKYEGKKIENLFRILAPFLSTIEELGYGNKKNGGNRMDNIKNLANAAYELVHLRYFGSSSNDRTWMIRDSLEALEKSKTAIKVHEQKGLENYEEIVSGVIFKTLERAKSDNKWMPTTDKITAFSKSLIKLLNDDFNGKIPSGQMKSYLINAFEFEYILASRKNTNERKESDKNE